ncbi:hypothetical protein J7K03_02770 [bacterium]|nr:hypothetical protein [bacterium]
MRKKPKHIILISLIVLWGIFCCLNIAKAGFGITPPDIVNEYLFPGASFEKTIYLVRGNPDEELTAEVTIEDSPIKDWITIENGMMFPLPKGEKKVPMKVKINVPEDAAYGRYKGKIQVRAISSGAKEGQVTTLLGGMVDIDLTVTEKVFSDFRVKTVSIPNVEKGNPVVVIVNLENLGNARTRPSKIHLEIYDLSHRKILRSADIFEIKGWVEAFQTGQVKGELPIVLDLGEYWADVSVYKGAEQVGFAKVHFRVIPPKERVVVQKPSFLTLSPLTAGLILVVVLVLIVLVIIFSKRKRSQIKEKAE